MGKNVADQFVTKLEIMYHISLVPTSLIGYGKTAQGGERRGGGGKGYVYFATCDLSAWHDGVARQGTPVSLDRSRGV